MARLKIFNLACKCRSFQSRLKISISCSNPEFFQDLGPLGKALLRIDFPKVWAKFGWTFWGEFPLKPFILWIEGSNRSENFLGRLRMILCYPEGPKIKKLNFRSIAWKKHSHKHEKIFSLEMFILGLRLSFSIKNFNPATCFFGNHGGCRIEKNSRSRSIFLLALGPLGVERLLRSPIL